VPLDGDAFEAIYGSPLPRSVETAAPLCKALRLDPVFDQRLVELEFETRTLAGALTSPDLLIWDGPHRGHPGGETLREFSARVDAWLDEVADRHSGSGVAVFTHSGVIDAAIRWAVGLAADTPWMHDFPLSNASVTEVKFWPRGRVAGGAPRYAEFRRMAETAHLRDCCSSI
jgi:probable phosphoglycerate mutase